MDRWPRIPSKDEAESLLRSSEFLWHQHFELAPGVFSPGASNIDFLLANCALPDDLSGATVLDIGTTNGGAAFALERRGAARVVAVDVMDPSMFGIDTLIAFFDSKVEFVRGSVYELPEVLQERFDVVLFWGVLYHLRHPLLALDRVREVSRGTVAVETAVADHELGNARGLPLARFYRRDELGADPSNWFAPSVALLCDWLGSSGYEPTRVEAWPADAPERAMVTSTVTSGPPEYEQISYEVPLRASVVRGST